MSLETPPPTDPSVVGACDVSSSWRVGNRLAASIYGLVLLIGIGLTCYRVINRYQTPGPFDAANAGYCDFHNGIYFPSQAMLDGVSPYGAKYPEAYPVERQIPFFSPAVLAVHAPLAMLPLRVAEVLYFGIMLAIIWLCSIQCSLSAKLGRRLDVVLLIATLIVYSRAGHATLFSGYFTLELILGTFVAISQAGRRPWLSAMALVLVSFKPTYILPIGFLMLARGNIREIVYGALLSIVAAAVPTLWIASNEGGGDVVQGLSNIIAQIGEAQEIHRADPVELPVNTWTRIDFLAVVAKWLNQSPEDMAHLWVMCAMLVAPVWILNRRRRLGIDDGLAGVTGAVILSTSLTAIYHHAYDLVLLLAPLTGIAASRLPQWKQCSIATRAMLAGMILFVLFNFTSAKSLLDKLSLGPLFGQVLTSLNAMAVFAFTVCICVLAIKQTWNKVCGVESTS